MSTDLGRASRRRGRRRPAIVNRAVLAVLRSPLHGLLDGRVCELAYLGRRSGREIALPVMYAEHGHELVVLVGDAAGKRWWRNFTEPAAIAVRQGGRVRAGIARLAEPDDPAYSAAVAAYARRHHVAHRPTDRLLLIQTAS